MADAIDFWAQKISIHAPVKGATNAHFCAVHRFAISIHAPVKGATRYHHLRGWVL